jgi:SAM-dependent methyltransferase
MRDEYDNIEDLWYSYLFNRIHAFILRNLAANKAGSALDVGCGTGFQSFLLAEAGYRVYGFDIAADLVEVAEAKAGLLGHHVTRIFSSSIPSAMKEQARILSRAAALRDGRAILTPSFRIGNALDTSSYIEGPFDVVVCCGSVLSFIDEYRQAITLMAQALRKGGLLFLEVEQKVTPDLLWSIFDALLKGPLGYDISFTEAIRNLFSKPRENIRLDYPFELTDGQELVLPLWIFSVGYLRNVFAAEGLKVIDRQAIHAVTNLIPSTVLHKQKPSHLLRMAFSGLATSERYLSRLWPFWRLGCSVMYCLCRE